MHGYASRDRNDDDDDDNDNNDGIAGVCRSQGHDTR